MVQAGDVAGMHSMLLDALANAQHGKVRRGAAAFVYSGCLGEGLSSSFWS